MTIQKRTTVLISLSAVLLLTFPATASAQEDGDGGLSRILQGLAWGDTQETVLDFYHELYIDDYRAEIAGLRDTLEIDEIRRYHDARYNRVLNSLESFDGGRTGYEASVLDGEVAPGNDEAMLTVRTENAILYYAFANDRLWKVVVSYNSQYLGGIMFDSFLDQVERRYGASVSTEMDETSMGIRYMARALWEEDHTRLRVENQSNVFGTFIMVFTSSGIEAEVDRLRGSGHTSSNEVVVSDLIRSISGENTDQRPASEDVADQILGRETIVELVIPPSRLADLQHEAAVAAGEEVASATAMLAQLGAEEEAEARAAIRRRRQRERDRANDTTTEPAGDGGITVY